MSDPSATERWARASREMGPPTSGDTWFGWLLVVAGAVAVGGALLPWITLQGPRARAVTAFFAAKGDEFRGLDHGGSVTVVLGVAIIGIGVGRVLGRLPRAGSVALVVGLGMGAVVVGGWADRSSVTDAVGLPAAALRQSVGVGVWVSALAAGAIIVGSGAELVVGRHRRAIDARVATGAVAAMVVVVAALGAGCSMVDPGEDTSPVVTTATTVAPAVVTSLTAPAATSTTLAPVPIDAFDLRSGMYQVACPGGPVPLSGTGEPGTGADGSSVRLDRFDPQYADVTGDGRLDAVVTVGCRLVGSRSDVTPSVVVASTPASAVVQVGPPLDGSDPEVVGRAVVVRRSLDGSGRAGPTAIQGFVVSWDGSWQPATPRRSTGDGTRATPQGIGPHQVGLTYAEAAVVAGSALIVDTAAPTAGDCDVLVHPGPTRLSSLGGRGVVHAIVVTSPDVQTAEGVGVGSTQDEVIQAYRGRLRSSPSATVPGGRRFVVSPDGDGLVERFTTDGRVVVALAVGEPEWAILEAGCD